jgi:two-component system nitrate/nitrite response regulator NarL
LRIRQRTRRGAALIRVFLADDHKMFVRGLSRTFSEATGLELVGTAENGKEALHKILELSPDVAVLDIAMPELSGLQILYALKQASCSQVKTLLLTGTEVQETVYEALSQGASGFMLKTADWDDLVAAIKRISKGETVIAPEAMKLLAGKLQQDPAGVLTDRERQVLSTLAQGFNVEDTAGRLQIAPETVRTHIKRIHKKLGVSNRGAAIAEAMRRGIIK